MDAAFEAARDQRSGDVHIDTSAFLQGLADAMAILASSLGQFPEDREQGAALIEALGKQIADYLQHAAARVRAGEVAPATPKRPNLRLIE